MPSTGVGSEERATLGLGPERWRVQLLSVALGRQRGEAAGEKGSQGQKTGLGLGCDAGDVIRRKE